MTPTAVGGAQDQLELLSQLAGSDNHTKLMAVLQLRTLVENHLILSILETWLPARQVLVDIIRNQNSYSHYNKLRLAVLELLLTCIRHDDLSQLSIWTRYVCDILYFCEVTPEKIDPQIGLFIRCFDAVVKVMPHIHVPDFSSAESRLMLQFAVEVLTCSAMYTPENSPVLAELVSTLSRIVLTNGSVFFTANTLSLTLMAMCKACFHVSDSLVAGQVITFINAALGNYHVPHSCFARVLVLLFAVYPDQSTAIESVFRLLCQSENTCHVTFATLVGLLERADYSEFLDFLATNSKQGTISYKDRFIRTVAEITKDKTTEAVKENVASPVSTLERYFPMMRRETSAEQVMSADELEERVFSGALKLLEYYIQDDDYSLLDTPSFIFDSDLYQFQLLMNALYCRVSQGRIVDLEKVLAFFKFLLRTLKVFKSIPDELFFYNMEDFEEDDGLVATKLMFDVLDKVYEVVFANIDLKNYPTLFLEGSIGSTLLKVENGQEEAYFNSLSEKEVIFFRSLSLYHTILSLLHHYCLDYEYRMKLETADMAIFYTRKLDILTYDSWIDLLVSLESSVQCCADAEYGNSIKNIVFVVLRVFTQEEKNGAFLFFVEDNKTPEDVKIAVLDTVARIITNEYFFYGNNERLWPLVVSLFGLDHGNGCYLWWQKSTLIQKQQLDNIKKILLVSKLEYFADILKKLFVDLHANEPLLGLAKVLVSLFIKSSVEPHAHNIKDGSEKAVLLFEYLVKLLNFCVSSFEEHSDEPNYVLESGKDTFSVFFVVLDCLTRLRSDYSNHIYFASGTREFKILAERSHVISKSETVLDHVVREVVYKNTQLGYLPADCFQRLTELTTTSDIDINKFLEGIFPLLEGKGGPAMLVFTWYLLALQLQNVPLFHVTGSKVDYMRQLACDQLLNRKVDLDKADRPVLVATLARLLVRLVIYTKDRVGQDHVTAALVTCLDSGDSFLMGIHALTVCCYEIPDAVRKQIHKILWRLETRVLNMSVAPHVLEFLWSVLHLPGLMSGFGMEDHRRIFAMAFRFIQSSNDKKKEASDKLTLYLSALSYNVISGWFLRVKMATRRGLAPFLIESLMKFAEEKQEIEAKATFEILVDFIQRFLLTNLDLRFQLITEKFNSESGVKLSRWVYGLSIISILTNTATGALVVTVRRPTGTTKFALQPHPAMVPLLNLADYLDGHEALVTQSYIFLQLLSHFQEPTKETPLLIPDRPEFARRIALFDKKPLIKVYKAGLIYIAPGQTSEKEMLLNSVGLREYQKFISKIGDLISLENNTTFYTAGLIAGRDGQHAYCWDDKVSQMLLHVTTLMPLDNEESWIVKKSHVGNDYVNIFFDESGKEFKFGVIASLFNFANIVITPVSLGLIPDSEPEPYYLVKTYLRKDIPSVFATCRIKTVRSSQLPVFVRNIAVIAYQLAQIWEADGGDIELNWADRYLEIVNIKEKVREFYDKKSEKEKPDKIGALDFTKYT